MRNIFNKSLFIGLSCLLATSVWAEDPTLAINTDAQGSEDFLKEYTSEGIKLSSPLTFGNGAVQIGNAASKYDEN